MIRRILIAENNKIVIDLPDDMVGKDIEVIIFEPSEAKPFPKSTINNQASNIDAIDEASDK